MSEVIVSAYKKEEGLDRPSSAGERCQRTNLPAVIDCHAELLRVGWVFKARFTLAVVIIEVEDTFFVSFIEEVLAPYREGPVLVPVADRSVEGDEGIPHPLIAIFFAIRLVIFIAALGR